MRCAGSGGRLVTSYTSSGGAWRRRLGGDLLACEPCRDCQCVATRDADRDRLRQEVVDFLC